MGSDLKHGFISSLKSAWQTLNDFARAHTASAQLQAELAIVANQIEEQEKQAQEGEPPTCDSLIKSFLCCVKWVIPFHPLSPKRTNKQTKKYMGRQREGGITCRKGPLVESNQGLRAVRTIASVSYMMPPK